MKRQPCSSTAAGPRTSTLSDLLAVRKASERLILRLEPEDLCLQGMADASPPKWHLGHTTWFFETFLLAGDLGQRLGHQLAPSGWAYLFNSYYDALGARHPRPQRGLLTRPAIASVLAWRERVDEALARLLTWFPDSEAPLSAAERQQLPSLLALGLHHEQQHQELLLMDLLDGFSRNPLEPAYEEQSAGFEARFQALATSTPEGANGVDPSWCEHPGGLVQIGHDGPGFHFDNEAPRHRVWLEPFTIAARLVSNGQYADFIADGGYARPELWQSEGWALQQQRGWQAPRYWRGNDEFGLAGRQPRRDAAPVRHLSWFEADAYARWAGARLPSEAEWELAAASDLLEQVDDLLWQWTATPYRPYPGFVTAPGAVGEYNGKFMSSQFVLRGGCFLTPPGHGRITYRNFYGPGCRWMAAGLRLARGGAPV
ncbi:MAG: ergothioneine biosynthesis protein EgtB [Cyanobium sp.]